MIADFTIRRQPAAGPQQRKSKPASASEKMAGTGVGILQVEVVACKHLKNKDWFSENDPFVVLSVKGGTQGRSTEVRTRELTGAGQVRDIWRAPGGGGKGGMHAAHCAGSSSSARRAGQLRARVCVYACVSEGVVAGPGVGCWLAEPEMDRRGSRFPDGTRFKGREARGEGVRRGRQRPGSQWTDLPPVHGLDDRCAQRQTPDLPAAMPCTHCSRT
jgi:hypothetical protein